MTSIKESQSAYAESISDAIAETFPNMLPLANFKKLDVRPLLSEGIEPFPEVRKRIAALQPGEGLMLIAPFLPSPLIERLGSEGFKSKLERGEAGTWIVYFWSEQSDAPD